MSSGIHDHKSIELEKSAAQEKFRKNVAKTLDYMKATKTIGIQAELRPDKKMVIEGVLCEDFSSCSYIGMETYKPALSAFVKCHDECGMSPKVADFFIKSSRRFELEKILGEICGGRAVITTSTSNASACFCDSVLQKADIVYTQSGKIHMSFIKYGALAREKGTTFVEGKLDDKERITFLASFIKPQGGILWIAADSWDSSYGEHIDWKNLISIAKEHENIGLFVDDAHGFGAQGTNGKGCFLEANNLDASRIVVAISLNKSLACYGGALILKDETDKFTGLRYADILENTSLPRKFQGALPPPLVAMNIDILKYVRTAEFAERQKRLKENCSFVHAKFRELNLPNTAAEDVPLKFLQLGYLERMKNFVHKMRALGFSTFPMFYPAVSLGRAGVRIAISSEHTMEVLANMCKIAAKVCGELDVVGPVTRVIDPFYTDE